MLCNTYAQFQGVYNDLIQFGHAGHERIIIAAHDHLPHTARTSCIHAFAKWIKRAFRRLFCCGGNAPHERIAQADTVMAFFRANTQHMTVKHLRGVAKIIAKISLIPHMQEEFKGLSEVILKNAADTLLQRQTELSELEKQIGDLEHNYKEKAFDHTEIQTLEESIKNIEEKLNELKKQQVDQKNEQQKNCHEQENSLQMIKQKLTGTASQQAQLETQLSKTQKEEKRLKKEVKRHEAAIRNIKARMEYIQKSWAFKHAETAEFNKLTEKEKINFIKKELEKSYVEIESKMEEELMRQQIELEEYPHPDIEAIAQAQEQIKQIEMDKTKLDAIKKNQQKQTQLEIINKAEQRLDRIIQKRKENKLSLFEVDLKNIEKEGPELIKAMKSDPVQVDLDLWKKRILEQKLEVRKKRMQKMELIRANGEINKINLKLDGENPELGKEKSKKPKTNKISQDDVEKINIKLDDWKYIVKEETDSVEKLFAVIEGDLKRIESLKKSLSKSISKEERDARVKELFAVIEDDHRRIEFLMRSLSNAEATSYLEVIKNRNEGVRNTLRTRQQELWASGQRENIPSVEITCNNGSTLALPSGLVEEIPYIRAASRWVNSQRDEPLLDVRLKVSKIKATAQDIEEMLDIEKILPKEKKTGINTSFVNESIVKELKQLQEKIKKYLTSVESQLKGIEGTNLDEKEMKELISTLLKDGSQLEKEFQTILERDPFTPLKKLVKEIRGLEQRVTEKTTAQKNRGWDVLWYADFREEIKNFSTIASAILKKNDVDEKAIRTLDEKTLQELIEYFSTTLERHEKTWLEMLNGEPEYYVEVQQKSEQMQKTMVLTHEQHQKEINQAWEEVAEADEKDKHVKSKQLQQQMRAMFSEETISIYFACFTNTKLVEDQKNYQTIYDLYMLDDFFAPNSDSDLSKLLLKQLIELGGGEKQFFMRFLTTSSLPGCHSLVQLACTWAAKNFKEIDENGLFMKLSYEYLSELLKQDYIHIEDEYDLLKKALVWLGKKGESVERIVSMLNHIRFEHITRKSVVAENIFKEIKKDQNRPKRTMKIQIDIAGKVWSSDEKKFTLKYTFPKKIIEEWMKTSKELRGEVITINKKRYQLVFSPNGPVYIPKYESTGGGFAMCLECLDDPKANFTGSMHFTGEHTCSFSGGYGAEMSKTVDVSKHLRRGICYQMNELVRFGSTDFVDLTIDIQSF